MGSQADELVQGIVMTIRAMVANGWSMEDAMGTVNSTLRKTLSTNDGWPVVTYNPETDCLWVDVQGWSKDPRNG